MGARSGTHALNSGDTAPRGAATTAAGNKVWVVDANKNVYVYDSSGGLLGSWSAGSLNGSSVVTGIATNGTDIWLVDRKQAKVLKYAGAASRLSGTQNAASSFSLNSLNAIPTDIVSDGTYLWVLNDAATDAIFKYTLSGTFLGFWFITGAGASPTGITVDPTGGSAIWIVDSGTRLVYQFDIGRTVTSGWLSPSTSFALAAGDTNPQGIADPPSGSQSRESTSGHEKEVVTGSRPLTSLVLHYHPLAVEADHRGQWISTSQAEFGLMPLQLDLVLPALPTARLAIRLSKRLRPALWPPANVGLE